MAEIGWTTQAADDLDSIAGFIAGDSEHYASLFVMDVLDAVQRLKDFPQSGRMVPEAQDPVIREILLGNYRIVYRTNRELVEILMVYHGARLLDPADLPQ